MEEEEEQSLGVLNLISWYAKSAEAGVSHLL